VNLLMYAFWPMATQDLCQISLVEPDGTIWTAGDLLERVNKLSRALQALGCKRGDRVAMVMHNEATVLQLLMATAQIGLYLVPINHHLTASEVAHIMRDCDAKVVFCSPDLAEKVAAAAETVGLAAECRFASGEVTGFGTVDALVAPQATDTPRNRSAGGTMSYTSGTTGKPKGVLRPLPDSPPELVAHANAMYLSLFGIQGRQDNVHLVVSPLYHTAILYFAGCALHLGHTVVMMDKWTPEGTMDRIDDWKVTTTHMVPTHLVRLLDWADEAEGNREKYNTSSLKQVIHGAAPCPVKVKQRMLEWWGPVIWEYYAASEGGGTLVRPEEWLARPGTVGRPWKGAEVIVVDDEGNDAAPGEVGTVWMKMETGAFEYHKDKEKTDKAHRTDGFFTVGDAGYMDEDGWLYLCDRKADMIISGGVNIYPAEIEGLLINHPAVADVCVFGIPHPDWGESVKAVIEPKKFPVAAGLEDEILTWAREELAGYKMPRSIDFVEALPRDPNGKLAKRTLRDPFWEGEGRSI
jgi:long-chain acyl-CoA synthetase